MSVLGTIRSNWRLLALVIILVVSLAAVFAPGYRDTTGPTNLQYGIELDGGTRLRAPVDALTATGVDVPAGNATVEEDVAASLGVSPIDVVVRRGAEDDTVEVLAGNVTEDEFVTALRDADVSVDPADVRQGATSETRGNLVEAINQKISAAGLSGATAREASTPTGEFFIVIEAPGRDAEELQRFLSDRGSVRIDAYYPADGNYTNRTVLERGSGTGSDDFENIGIPQYDEQEDQWYLSVTLSEETAPRYSQDMVETGFDRARSCPFREGGYGSLNPNIQPAQQCLLVISDDEVVSSFGVRQNLATSFGDGTFSESPTISFEVNDAEAGRELMIHLRAGRLPAPLDFGAGTQFEVQPPLAEQFKRNSLLTGILAVFAVAGAVFVRYRDPLVAAPMIVTALSEVVVLLGFASAVGLALDLSHIAGFIAVIGTGVDDLIIIADEVMGEGDVASGRVFRNRFRRAFWVIGAAAATTIIAMSPLAYLGLGDLRGFAIVTIVGVLIGVLITRPAYGDILRHLLTDR